MKLKITARKFLSILSIALWIAAAIIVVAALPEKTKPDMEQATLVSMIAIVFVVELLIAIIDRADTIIKLLKDKK